MIDEVEVLKAIGIVQESRITHVEWAEFLQETPDWQPSRLDTAETTVGALEHHRVCIEQYDKVLKVLNDILPIVASRGTADG